MLTSLIENLLQRRTIVALWIINGIRHVWILTEAKGEVKHPSMGLVRSSLWFGETVWNSKNWLAGWGLYGLKNFTAPIMIIFPERTTPGDWLSNLYSIEIWEPRLLPTCICFYVKEGNEIGFYWMSLSHSILWASSVYKYLLITHSLLV